MAKSWQEQFSQLTSIAMQIPLGSSAAFSRPSSVGLINKIDDAPTFNKKNKYK
jgi:hypothetical protein